MSGGRRSRAARKGRPNPAALALALALTAGCARAPKPEPALSDSGPSRGDHVVVEQTAARFFEGRVLGGDGATLRVERLDGADPASVARGDVYRLPAPNRRWNTGQLAVCSPQPARWVACRVEAVNGTKIVARDADEKPLTLDASKLLAPTGVTELNLERHFARTRVRAAFAEAVLRAGAPRVPRSWRPSGKERVVARNDAGWFSARVREIEDDGVFVEWASDGRVTRIGPRDLVPEPPSGAAPERGALALLRPEAATRAWQPVRVVSAGPEYVVENGAGERRNAALRDLLPLDAP